MDIWQTTLPCHVHMVYECHLRLTLTGRTLSCFGFLQIYRNKSAQQMKFLGIYFFGIIITRKYAKKFPLLGTFVAIDLKKPETGKCPACQS